MSRTSAFETIALRGLTISLHTDEDARSPDEWENNDIFLAYDTRRVRAGSKGYARGGADHADAYHVFALDVKDGPYTTLYLGDVVAAPVEDDEDEDRTDGYVYVSRKEWPDEDGARKAAESLVEEWNTYLSGDVYGYTVEDEDGEQVESCWGFYGIDAVREEARAAANSHADKRDEEQARELLNDNDPRRHLATVPTEEDCTGSEA